MAFFTSEYECKLDTKGRLVLPAKIKVNLPEVSGNELVVMKGFDPNLVVYTMLGRFLIPKAWIEHAKLEKNVIVIGTGNTIEIWNPDMYDQYLIEDSEEYSDLAKKFLDE